MHHLVERKNYRLVKYFVDLYGPDIDFMTIDSLGKTPLMSAYEIGHVGLIKLLFNKTKAHLDKNKCRAIKRFVKCIQDAEPDSFSNTLLKQKMICVDKFDKDDIRLVPSKHHMIKLDGRAFCTLWYEYLVLAKKFNVPISEYEDVTEDMGKQIIFDRVNKELSAMFDIVILIVARTGDSLQDHPEYLSLFLQYLPYNFKLVLVKTEPAKDSIESSTVEKFLALNFLDVTSFDKMQEEKCLFLQVFDKRPQNEQDQGKFFEQLGDCFMFCLKIYDKAAENYDQACSLTLNRNDETELDLLTKTCRAYWHSKKKGSDDYFKRAKAICESSTKRSVSIARFYEYCAHSMLANISDAQFSVDKMAYFERAFSIYSEIGDRKDVLDVLLHICTEIENILQGVFFCAVQTTNVLVYAQKLWHMSQDQSLDKKSIAYFLFGFFLQQNPRCNQSLSLKFYKEAIRFNMEFYKSAPNVSLAKILYCAAFAYEALNEPEAALDYRNRALNMYELIYKKEHFNIALIWYTIGTMRAATRETICLGAQRNIDILEETIVMFKRLTEQ